MRRPITVIFLSSFVAVATALVEHSVYAQAEANTSTPYSSSVEIQAKRTSDFHIDGNLNKKVWKGAKWSEFDHAASGMTRHPEALTSVAAAWTEKFIYFAFSCHYDVLNTYEGEDISKERWELWNRDVAEIFLNPEPQRITHYYEFEVAPNNQWIDLEIEKKKTPFNDAAWNSDFEHATRIDKENHIWVAELRIPLHSMKVDSVRAGQRWRVNFCRATGKGTDDQRKFLAWSIIPDGNTFHVPARFGILALVK
jgi:alpha-galactosidase